MIDSDIWKPDDPVPAGYVLADTDGLPARDQGPWARDKLSFLRKYLPGAIGATKKKRGHTHYLDLFAGPGRNAWVDGTRQEDFPGSPLIALGARFQFKDRDGPVGLGHFHFCNINRLDHSILAQRIVNVVDDLDWDIGTIDNRLGDANEEVYAILDEIPAWSYIAAFIDIEGPSDLPFETVRALRSSGHESVDVYVLFPVGGIRRILPYDSKERERFRDTLDRYFGTTEWERVVTRRTTESHAKRMDRELRELYMEQLRGLWEHVEHTMSVRGPKGLLYQMLFAYDHQAAGSIAASAERVSAQPWLFDEPKDRSS